MSRLQEELAKRAQPTTHTAAEVEILNKFNERMGKFRALLGNKDFQEYLKLEAEMNDPKIVVAYKCSDPICESLKAKIRDFWTRQRVLTKVQAMNGAESAHQRAASDRAARRPI